MVGSAVGEPSVGEKDVQQNGDTKRNALLACLGCANVASALSWPDESQEIEARDFVDRNGQHWVCDLFDGHESFVDLGREYYFEDTDQLDDSGNITGLFHSVTFDRGTLIAQGFQPCSDARRSLFASCVRHG